MNISEIRQSILTNIPISTLQNYYYDHHTLGNINSTIHVIARKTDLWNPIREDFECDFTISEIRNELFTRKDTSTHSEFFK